MAAEMGAAEIVCAFCGGRDLVADAWAPLPPAVAGDPTLAAALACAWCRDCQSETRLIARGDEAQERGGGG
jgi:hypothetical protein